MKGNPLIEKSQVYTKALQVNLNPNVGKTHIFRKMNLSIYSFDFTRSKGHSDPFHCTWKLSEKFKFDSRVTLIIINPQINS